MLEFVDFVTANFDALTFGAFFGCLIVLGIAELRYAWPRPRSPRRGRWPANVALTALNLIVMSVLPLTGVGAAFWAQSQDFGVMNTWSVPFALAIVGGFLLRSLVSYGVHVAMHKIPVLWRLHRVHHCDTDLDVSTTVRFHPLEIIVSLPVVAGTIALFGVPPVVVMLYEVFDAILAVATHANLRLPARLERILQTVLVTPAMHRVHHSSRVNETDSNYGATLSIWDRVFSTYVPHDSTRLEAMELGLREFRDVNATSALLAMPFRDSPVRDPALSADKSPDA